MDPREQFTERIRRNQAKFSPSDRKIADYLINSYPGCLLETAVAMSEKLGVSVATITRFFPKIEFASIRQAQDECLRQLDFLNNSPLDRYHQKAEGITSVGNLFDQAWELDIANIQGTYRNLTQEKVETFVDLVCDHRRAIYIIGERKMFALTFYMYVQLNSLHPNVTMVKTDQCMIADQVVNVRRDDLLIAFDFRRYPTVNIQLAEIFRDAGGRIAVIGDSPISPCANMADVHFLVESKGMSIFDSYTAGFTLTNSLLAVVTQRSGNYVRERYEVLEQYYRRFGIFARQQLGTNINKLPAGEDEEK